MCVCVAGYETLKGHCIGKDFKFNYGELLDFARGGGRFGRFYTMEKPERTLYNDYPFYAIGPQLAQAYSCVVAIGGRF